MVKKGKYMIIGTFKSSGWDETTKELDEKNKTKCSKCGKIPANIKYKGKEYCTWYCAKKG
jgi:hypothetical protein